MQQTQNFIEKRINLQDAEVLEVGCGSIWTVYLAQRVKCLTAIDIHEHIIETAKLYIGQIGLSAKVIFKTGDAYELCKGKLFDFIFLKDVLEHVSSDKEFLAKLVLLLKPTGKLYLSRQNRFSLNYLVEGGYHRLHGNRNWCGWDPTHYRFYTKSSLDKLLKQVGLCPLAWPGMYHFPYWSLSRWLLGRLIKHPMFLLLKEYGGISH